MPPIKLKKVISVSSEDSTHQAENLLDYGFRTKWKCKSPSDKEVSVVMQLEKPSKILSVDICNENSAFIEILVSRSDRPGDFEVLLKKATLMTAEDAKTGKGVNDNKYFTMDALCTKVRDQHWDLVKLVCSQPYVNTQYGLSFIVFRVIELKEQPSFAMVTDRKLLYRCSGTVISNWHILSGCLSFAKILGNWRQALDAYEFKVVAGIVDLEQSKKSYAQIRDVSFINLHPECKKTPFASVYDMGIILLRSPFVITEYVSPANLAFYVEGLTQFSIPKDKSCFILSLYESNSNNATVRKEGVNIQDCSSDKLAKNVSDKFDCGQCYFCTSQSPNLKCSRKLSGAPIFCSDQITGIYNTNDVCDKLYYFGTLESSMFWITYTLTLGETYRSVPSVFVIILTSSLLVIAT